MKRVLKINWPTLDSLIYSSETALIIYSKCFLFHSEARLIMKISLNFTYSWKMLDPSAVHVYKCCKKWCRPLLALGGGILASQIFCDCDTLCKNHSYFYPFEILHSIRVTFENFVQWMAHSFPFKMDINSSWNPHSSIFILDIRYPGRRIRKRNQPGRRTDLFNFMLSLETKAENTILMWEIIWTFLNLITKLWLCQHWDLWHKV